eukprot:3787035-Amphidinium_carterae.3
MLTRSPSLIVRDQISKRVGVQRLTFGGEGRALLTQSCRSGIPKALQRHTWMSEMPPSFARCRSTP